MPRPTEDPGDGAHEDGAYQEGSRHGGVNHGGAHPDGAYEDGAYEPGTLRVAVDDEGAVRVVTVSGELDHDTANGLRDALALPLADGLERIVIDLAGLRFCDSTGLNILLRARLDAEAAGRALAVAAPRPVVARLFSITGADSVLPIHPDRASALGPADAPGPADASSPP